MDEARAIIAAIGAREQTRLEYRRLDLSDAATREGWFLHAMAALGVVTLGGATATAISAANAETRAAIEREEVKRQALTRRAHAQRMEVSIGIESGPRIGVQKGL